MTPIEEEQMVNIRNAASHKQPLDVSDWFHEDHHDEDTIFRLETQSNY